MGNEAFIKIVNKIVKDKVFQYKGPLFVSAPIECKIDFKFKLLGDKILIFAGNPENYVSLDVTILNIEPEIFSGLIKSVEDNQYLIGKDMYAFKIKLEDYIQSILKNFGVEDSVVLSSIRYIKEK